ncbi:MIP transporter [Polychaeton citri CBS 116435]|uniref:MIP transporter n=1 Tax=Polychaeton citri CBS 116435 TaxID=1314669 RepID=A0A9P4UKN1_9PEZI|nr:MIP transporter [Polychaeton citri CBS 116435]
MPTTSSYNNGEITQRARIADATFAGRVGGNQEFIASPDNISLLERQPDAAPLRSLTASFNLDNFADGDIWRMALLEGLGSMLLIFLLGGPAIGLTTLDQSLFAKTLYASLTSWFALSIFTFCLGPVSGGHINPSITLATFFAGLCTFPRAVLYIAAQSIGAIIAAFLLKLGVGGDNYFEAGLIPGCTVDTTMVSVGQMFTLEFMFGLTAIFMAFGVGLDPRQGKIYGPAFGPVLVGITLGLVTLCSAIIRPGYTGASLNPARCLGLMTAKYELENHWVHWVAQLAATSLNGMLYHTAPPWRKEDPLLSQVANYLSRYIHLHKRRNERQAPLHHE